MLEHLDVQEMNQNELVSTDGGFWWLKMWGGINFISDSSQFCSSDFKNPIA